MRVRVCVVLVVLCCVIAGCSVACSHARSRVLIVLLLVAGCVVLFRFFCLLCHSNTHSFAFPLALPSFLPPSLPLLPLLPPSPPFLPSLLSLPLWNCGTEGALCVCVVCVRACVRACRRVFLCATDRQTERESACPYRSLALSLSRSLSLVCSLALSESLSLSLLSLARILSLSLSLSISLILSRSLSLSLSLSSLARSLALSLSRGHFVCVCQCVYVWCACVRACVRVFVCVTDIFQVFLHQSIVFHKV